MHVTVLVPAIHDRPTGGNIYNRRTITELRRYGTVEVAEWGPQTDPPALSPNGPIVVDSLLLSHEEGLRALRATHPDAPLVLLAHYLHCIDPNEQDSPTAARERAVLPVFDAVVTTSRYAQRAVVNEGVPHDQIAVVPPGLDAAYRAPVPARPPRETPRLLTVANLLPGKGLRALVDVLASLGDTAWTWTLVGDAALDATFADQLHDRIRASAIADRVTCTGVVPEDELRTQYDQSDVFVLPSRFETCSMATREAMARGLPVVAHEVGGIPDNFAKTTGPEGAPAGHLVPPDDPDAFSDALRALLTDPAARTRMGQAARTHSQAFPTWAEAGTRFHTALRATGR